MRTSNGLDPPPTISCTNTSQILLEEKTGVAWHGMYIYHEGKDNYIKESRNKIMVQSFVKQSMPSFWPDLAVQSNYPRAPEETTLVII
jgi:hypothetical protein